MKDTDDIKLEIKKQFKENNNQHNNKILLIIIIICLSPIIVLFLIPKPHQYVQNVDNLPEPIQMPTTWWTTMKIDGTTIYIDFLAEYDIQWRVLATRNYDDSFMWNIWNKISPRDFVLWWWPIMSKRENIKKFEFEEYLSNRQVFVRPKYEYIERLGETFNIDPRHKNLDNRKPYITTRSNNHPIWSNIKINRLFKKVKVWDVIRLKWYLVYVHWDQWNWWPSSLVRDDEWCEIIYVTNISWLKDGYWKERFKNNLLKKIKILESKCKEFFKKIK